MNWFLPTLWWYIATLLATIATMPLTVYLFRRCVGRGAGFARPIGMLLVIWPIWFLSGWSDRIALWTGPALWASLIIIGVVGWTLALRHRTITRDTLRHYALAELVYLIAFIAFLWLRGYGPDANWTEKPGELMMLGSVMQSTSMPPHDAWLSGELLNYYYLGYAIFGGFGKMTRLMPAEVFNLALITTFAMAVVAIAGVIAMVLGRFYSEFAARIGGIVGMLMALVMGNWWSTWKVLIGESGGNDYWNGIGWHASRIFRDSLDPDYGYNPITEFPSFSFVLGDLHPHVMALPFVATSLGIAWMLLTLGRVGEGESFWRRDLVRISVAGGLLGSLYALNSWDFPTYAGIAALALLFGTVGLGWRTQLGSVVVLGASSIIAWLPFHLHFIAPSRPVDSTFGDIIGHIPVIGGLLQSIALYQGDPTRPGEFFGLFGFQYTIMLLLILGEVFRRREPIMSYRLRRLGEQPYTDPYTHYFAIGFGVLCLLGAIVLPVHLLLFCGLPVIVIWLLLERDARLTPANVALVLYAFALLLLLIPEFFYISDIYTGSRMNTVFKVTYQVWLIMSVASGIGVVALWKSVRWNAVLRVTLPAAVAGMLTLGLAYPIVASQQWLDWRNPNREWVGVDGLAYLKTDPESLDAAEYAAIQWLWDHADDNDVILTSGGGEWDYAVGRVSSATGVPTIMGWIGHENQWHLGDTAMLAGFPQRINDIDAMYQLPLNTALLDKYGVTFIYIGPVEMNGSSLSQSDPGRMSTIPVEVANNDDFPGDGWELVFEQNGVRIYQRVSP